MARFAGTALNWYFITSGGGTVLPSADYRSWNIDDSATEIDASAGADTYKQFLAGQSERKATFEYLVQTAAGSPSGTATYAQLAPQTEGTIFWGPEGTASGKPKYSAPGIILGRAIKYGYQDVVTATIQFRLTAADTIATF